MISLAFRHRLVPLAPVGRQVLFRRRPVPPRRELGAAGAVNLRVTRPAVAAWFVLPEVTFGHVCPILCWCAPAGLVKKFGHPLRVIVADRLRHLTEDSSRAAYEG